MSLHVSPTTKKLSSYSMPQRTSISRGMSSPCLLTAKSSDFSLAIPIFIYLFPRSISRRSRTIIENAIESCLQVITLSPETTAKARILRARARLANGSHFSAREGRCFVPSSSFNVLIPMTTDLQAALDAEPDNPEAKALLHQRSVTVEKVSLNSGSLSCPSLILCVASVSAAN